MTIWVLLLRGVNVAGANRLPMAEFRALLGELGCGDVQTYIQSGNAVFQSDQPKAELESRIAEGIARRFGFRPALFLLRQAQIDAALAANPFPQGAEDPKAVHLFFLAHPAPDSDLTALDALATGGEAFVLTDAAFYLYAPNGIGRSALADKLPRLLKAPHTARNLRSVQAIAALARTLTPGG
ncbi:MAG TPA: DUF1697 domain-containing protein [Paracoccaceae bacterium]